MQTTTKSVAFAFLYGIKLAYKNKLRESRREVLEDLLDDMALALTAYAVENENERIDKYAGILGDLLDELDWPESIRPENTYRRRKKKHDQQDHSERHRSNSRAVEGKKRRKHKSH